jgi:hypothetical protein
MTVSSLPPIEWTRCAGTVTASAATRAGDARGRPGLTGRAAAGVGVKVAGGIRTAKDAIRYLVLVNETAGPAWLTADLFRIGASSLLNDLLMQRRKQLTGVYSGPDYSPSTEVAAAQVAGAWGGPWLCRVRSPVGLMAVVVPSGLPVSFQPHWWTAIR